MADEPTIEPASPGDARDQHRERRIWWALVGLGAVIVLGIMILLWPIIRGRLDAAKSLDTATVIISQSDSDIELVARTVAAEPSAETSDVIADVQRKIPPMRGELARGIALLDVGYNRLTDDEQRRATLTRAVLAARVAMLDAAAPILSAEASAGIAAPDAAGAWDRAIQASETEKAAVSAYDLKTTAGLTQAAALAKQAGDGFSAAEAGFGGAAAAFPAAKLDAYTAYMRQRTDELELLKRAIAARQAKNVAQANALVVQYNAAQTRSAQAARTLPGAPSPAIADALRLEVAAKRAAFDKAKSEADNADSALKGL